MIADRDTKTPERDIQAGHSGGTNLVRAQEPYGWCPVCPGGHKTAGTGHSVGTGTYPALTAGTSPSRRTAEVSRLFAIDPGTTESGWVLLEAGKVADCGIHDNHDVLRWIKAGQGAQLLAIENIAGMGMTVGQSTFDTCRWIGRFQQAWADPEAVVLVLRRQVKSYLCGNQQAKDPNIRQALLNIFPATGGGERPQIGTKAKPGPLYGVTSHAWSALAVAMTVAGTRRLKGVLPVMPQAEFEGVA